MPPVLPSALASLGFLTSFDFNDYKPVMDAAIDNGVRVDLRMCFTCTVYHAIAEKEIKKRNEGPRTRWVRALEGGYPQTPRLMAGKIKRSSVLRRGQWRHLKSLMISLWIAGHRRLLACSSCSVHAYHLSFHEP